MFCFVFFCVFFCTLSVSAVLFSPPDLSTPADHKRPTIQIVDSDLGCHCRALGRDINRIKKEREEVEGKEGGGVCCAGKFNLEFAVSIILTFVNSILICNRCRQCQCFRTSYLFAVFLFFFFGFLTSSSTTRLYCGRVPRLTSDNFTSCHTRDRAGRPRLLSQPVTLY